MYFSRALPFLFGWMADRLLGDPEGRPHPVVFFGQLIRYGEKKLNRGADRMLKGGLLTLALAGGVFYFCQEFLRMCRHLNEYLPLVVTAVGVYYCLAGKNLIDEVVGVFEATARSVEAGRKRLARIVGRDTDRLSAQQIRTAALETLSENLSDGVVAPMFWFLLLGLPGMAAYKMVNTLDSMIGYKNERYREFGRFAARLDDLANYLPARLTAVLMLLAANRWKDRRRVWEEGKKHPSPNAGYPEAALAVILDCRFGGPNFYDGRLMEKPYIGRNARALTDDDLQTAVKINTQAEWLMGICVCILLYMIE